MRSAAIIPFTPRQVTLRKRPAKSTATVISLVNHRRKLRMHPGLSAVRSIHPSSVA